MPIRCDQTVLRELFLACANRVHQFAPKSFSTEMLEKLSQQTRTMLSDKSVPLVWGHRDFVPQHVFVNGASGAIAGIIDWEFSQEGELPLIDAINFQVHAIHECQGITTSAAYLQFLRSNTRSLDRYTDRMGLDEPTVKALLLLYWPWLVDMHITGMFRDRVEKSVARYLSDFESTIETALKILFETRGHMNDFSVPSPRLHELAGELGAYSGAPLDQVRARLEKELRRLGDRMAEQWREQRPVTSRQIERFYRETDGYLYELLIDGENPFRAATRDAITQALREVNAQRVFEFGGGIGTDAMWFARAGFQWTYYDLPGGQTFRFAAWRFAKNKLPVTVVAHPSQSAGNDAVISIEVFEHLTNLFAALRTINRTLRPGGLLIFTESFGKTERHPLHLARVALQGRFLTELLRATGFKSLSRFGPEDYLYRAVKCREAAWHDCPRAVALICGRVIRKAPVKLWRALFGPRLATGHSQS
jgi:2-polyprenyl-3-methyl-5-hydroxy-6-metoxy-1,4-benzoquinol methylase